MDRKVKLRSGSDVELVDFMGGDDSVAMSAWISFNNDNEERLQDRNKVNGLINFLYRNGHHTPFESSVFTFRVETPMFVVREVQRHRSQSMNEWSGRYSKMLPNFYTPSSERPIVQHGKAGDYSFIEGSPEQYAMVDTAHVEMYTRAWNLYEEMLDAGIAKEVARMHLPLATYSQLYITVNARNLMHFLNLRTHEQALYEIREVANQMETHLRDRMPYTYAAWKEHHG